MSPRSRLSLSIAAAATAAAVLGGCAPVRGEVAPVAPPVAGYQCPIEAELVPGNTELTWHFGDGTSEVGGDHTIHCWAAAGMFRVTAKAPGLGSWRGTVRVTDPKGPVDLARLLRLDITSPGGRRLGRVLVYRPGDQLYAVVSEAPSLTFVEDSLRDAQLVDYAPRPWAGTELHLLDEQGAYLGKVYEDRSVVALSPASGAPDGGGYVLRTKLFAAVLEGVVWQPGNVLYGLVVPLQKLPLAALPPACLGLEAGSAARDNVVDLYGLSDSEGLTLADAKRLLVHFTAAEQPAHFQYLLALLSAASRASASDLQGLPEDWFSCPFVTITFGGTDPVSLGFFGGLFAVSRPTDASPESVFLVTAELKEFLARFSTSLGLGW